MTRTWRWSTAALATSMLTLAIASSPGSVLAEESTPPAADRPAKKPFPGEPHKKIAKDIESVFGAPYKVNLFKPSLDETIKRDEAIGYLVRAVREWNRAIAPDNALRAVPFWKARLAATQPESNPSKRRQFVWGYSIPDMPEVNLLVNVPSRYTIKDAPYPLIVVAVDKNSDPKVIFKQHYGPLLESHIIVGYPLENAAAAETARMVLLATVYATENFRIDPDKMVLDGLGSTGKAVAWLAEDSAIYFSGTVLRSPPEPGLLAKNLALNSLLVLAPKAGAAEAHKQVQPAVTVLTGSDAAESFASQAEAVCAWIAAVPPRTLSDPANPYTWTARTNGIPQKCGFWFQVDRTWASGDDLTVEVSYELDAAANAVNIRSRNLDAFTCLLSDEVLDLDHPVVVRVNGIEVKRSIVQRKIETAISWSHGHPMGRNFLATAELSVPIPEEARLPESERRAIEEAERKAREAEKGAEGAPSEPAKDGESEEDEGEEEGEDEEEEDPDQVESPAGGAPVE